MPFTCALRFQLLLPRPPVYYLCGDDQLPVLSVELSAYQTLPCCCCCPLLPVLLSLIQRDSSCQVTLSCACGCPPTTLSLSACYSVLTPGLSAAAAGCRSCR
jgi:hypothetical protein